jgi:hypothetical protein
MRHLNLYRLGAKFSGKLLRSRQIAIGNDQLPEVATLRQ